MDKVAKQILDRLKAAKVSAALCERTRRLIDEAHDWDAEGATQVEAVARYVCGVSDELPKLSKKFLEHRAAELLRGFSNAATFDAWELRALDVIATCHKYYWFWELDSALRDKVEKHPDQPVFETALEQLRARGLWATDTDVIASLVGSLNAHVTKDGAPTSTGRWLLERIDRDAKSVFAIARDQKDDGKKVDRTSVLFPLLSKHRRKLFDELIPTLKFRADSDKSELAETLLETDAKAYETAALALIEQVKDPYACYCSAENLEQYFPKQHTAEVKRLLIRGVKEEGAYKLAWPALGDAATEVWDAYDEENDALRLDFYATIEKQAKAKALPWLIEGLVYPKDPKVEYGFVTHAKYVARMVALVKKYDIAPYRERIEKAFAKIKSPKIHEELAKLLGTKGKTKPTSAAALKPIAGKDGYRFDAYVASVVKAALAAAKQHTLPEPIENVKLAGFQGEIQLNALVIEGQGDTVTVELAVPKSRVPGHIDVTDSDKVLPAFLKRHGLADGDDEVPSWGDMYKLPWCALIMEQIDGAHAIVAGLKQRGVKVAKKCKVGVGEDDNFWESADGFLRMTRTEIAALPKAQQADFAAVCFEAAAKQRPLLK